MPSSSGADRESARSDPEAKRRFLRFLNRSLSAVNSTAQWVVVREGDLLVARTVPAVVDLRCRSSDNRLYLRSTLQFTYEDDPRFPGERKVSTKDYAHTVASSPELSPQLYSWEWSASEPQYPHVHVRRGDADFKGLGKLHIPTGRVFFEHVLLFLIAEHDVQHVRDDWESALGESLGRVRKYSTWGGGSAP